MKNLGSRETDGVTFGQFAASLLFGILSVLLPLIVFVGLVALLVYLARRWTDGRKPGK